MSKKSNPVRLWVTVIGMGAVEARMTKNRPRGITRNGVHVGWQFLNNCDLTHQVAFALEDGLGIGPDDGPVEIEIRRVKGNGNGN